VVTVEKYSVSIVWKTPLYFTRCLVAKYSVAEIVWRVSPDGTVLKSE
jgi:hypothetical protein